MNRMLILLALACAAAGAAAADKQQVYKWKDANGVVHFTDTPPPKETPNVQAVHMIGGAPTPDESAAPTPADKPTDATTAAPAGPAEIAAQRAAVCKSAHTNFDLLQSKFPVNILGPDGKPQPLDDKTRQAQLDIATQQIAQNCQ